MRFVMVRHAGLDEKVDLPSGMRVRVRGSTVAVGGDIAGIAGVVRLVHEPDGTSASPLARRPAPVLPTPTGPVRGGRVVASTSPAWRAAAATADQAMEAGQAVVILGEQSTGRATLLSDVYFSRHPAGSVVHVQAGEVEAAPHRVADRFLQPRPEREMHVLRDVDRLSPATARVLVARLKGDALPLSYLAATASSTAGGPGNPVLALFGASASIPPLRHRSADIPALLRDLLEELAPHREVRLDDEALRVMVHYAWPGNVHQLREALTSALHLRPVGCIQVRDLPAYCSSTPRGSLRPVDEAERDAIVTALRSAGGNKVAAAMTLGLARSTLCRKIRQYGITD